MLTDAKIKAAETPIEKPYKLYDSDGLYVVINPGAGAKWWRFKYRINGKEKKLSLGVYPEVSLAMAREKRNAARVQVAAGIDPSEHRQEQKKAKLVDSSALFSVVAESWLSQVHASHVSPKSLNNITARLRNHILPELGGEEVSKIDAPRVLEVIRKIESTGHVQVAYRARHDIGRVLRYGAVNGKGSSDVTINLKGMTAARPATRHRPAVTGPAELSRVLAAVWGYDGSAMVREACKLLPYTLCRPAIIACAEWQHMDLTEGLWLVPGELMKTRQPLVVPLARQVVSLLQNVRSMTGSNRRFVFPHRFIDVKHVCVDSISKAFITMGYQDVQTAHGFRATGRTILDETLGYRPEWIEMQLAHKVKGPNGEAYPRMKFMEQRRGMMQSWADYLDKLRLG